MSRKDLEITQLKLIIEELGKEVLELRHRNSELEKISMIDGLTEIPNRRFFDTRVEQELRKAKRDIQPLSLVMIDIDYFKKFNDFYGHQKGDVVLKSIAQKLQSTLYRPGDIVARYGGEEFIFVLPNTPGSGAEIVAEIARGRIEELDIEHVCSDVSDVVTLSMGIATLSNKEDTVKSLLEEADQNLYRAKKCGRNRVYQ